MVLIYATIIQMQLNSFKGINEFPCKVDTKGSGDDFILFGILFGPMEVPKHREAIKIPLFRTIENGNI
jgi:hypothetical protein